MKRVSITFLNEEILHSIQECYPNIEVNTLRPWYQTYLPSTTPVLSTKNFLPLTLITELPCLMHNPFLYIQIHYPLKCMQR